MRLQRSSVQPWLRALASILCVCFVLTHLEQGFSQVSLLAPTSKVGDSTFKTAVIKKLEQSSQKPAESDAVKEPPRRLFSLSRLVLMFVTGWTILFFILSLVNLQRPIFPPGSKLAVYPYSAFRIAVGWAVFLAGLNVLAWLKDAPKPNRGRLRGVLTVGRKLGWLALTIFVALDRKIPAELLVEQLRVGRRVGLVTGNFMANLDAQVLLRKYGRVAVGSLTRALKDEDPLVRQDAVAILGDIGPDAAEAVAALVEALKDNDGLVRLGAARALGRIGSEAQAAIPALKKALEGADPALSWQVEWALGRIQGPTRDGRSPQKITSGGLIALGTALTALAGVLGAGAARASSGSVVIGALAGLLGLWAGASAIIFFWAVVRIGYTKIQVKSGRLSAEEIERRLIESFRKALDASAGSGAIAYVDEETKAIHVDKARMAYLPRWIQEFVLAHESAHVKGWGKVGAYLRQVFLWPGVLWGKDEIASSALGEDQGPPRNDNTKGDSYRRVILPEIFPLEPVLPPAGSPFAEFLREIALSERSLAPAAAVVEPGAVSSILAQAA